MNIDFFPKIKGICSDRIRTRQIVRMVVCLLMCSFLLEFFLIFDIQKLFKIIESKETRASYTIENTTLVNCRLENGKIISEGDDPQLVITDIDNSIGLIEIVIKNMSSSTMPIELFYENTEHTFSADYELNGRIQENKASYFYELNQVVSSLRIDIGCSSQDAYVIEKIILNPNAVDILAGNFFNMSPIRMLWYFIGLSIFFFAFRDIELFKHFCFQYRWGLGICFVILCTICKLHGSSIGELNNCYPYGADTSRLWGSSRAIRSDEYVVFTEMALAQVQSGFNWFSDIWGYSSSDMFMVYGQPIKNLVAIYRPFSLGYLLLGAERGLAFYWSSRLACCFLVSFEFGRLLTKDNRCLSLAYAFLVALAPVVQWWYSINELVEMLIFGQSAIVLMFWYLKTEKYRIKILATAGLVLCAGGYVMTLYPAWMIPLFYVFAAAVIAMIIDNKEYIRIRKQDIVIWLSGISIFFSSMLYIYMTSADTIHAVMNTAYPGSRIYTGGPISNLIELFRGWTSYLWTFIAIDNPCEKACFISFAPVGFIFSLIEIFKYKRKDPWLILLNIVNVGMVFFFLLSGWNDVFAKIILLSQSVATRMVTAIGFVNLLILFRAITYANYKEKTKNCLLLISPIIGAFSLYIVQDNLNPALKTIVMIVVIAAIWLLLHISDQNNQKRFLLFVIGISFVGGVLVNPIDQGLSTIYRSPIVQAIETENQKEEGMWVVVNGGFLYNNIPTIVGAKTLNAVATYPDTKLWEQLQLADTESKKIWNRYAHQCINISDTTCFEPIIHGDMFTLNITIKDLKKLGVKYILNMGEAVKNRDLETMFTYGNISIQKIHE